MFRRGLCLLFVNRFVGRAAEREPQFRNFIIADLVYITFDVVHLHKIAILRVQSANCGPGARFQFDHRTISDKISIELPAFSSIPPISHTDWYLDLSIIQKFSQSYCPASSLQNVSSSLGAHIGMRPSPILCWIWITIAKSFSFSRRCRGRPKVCDRTGKCQMQSYVLMQWLCRRKIRSIAKSLDMLQTNVILNAKDV